LPTSLQAFFPGSVCDDPELQLIDKLQSGDGGLGLLHDISYPRRRNHVGRCFELAPGGGELQAGRAWLARGEADTQVPMQRRQLCVAC